MLLRTRAELIADIFHKQKIREETKARAVAC